MVQAQKSNRGATQRTNFRQALTERHENRLVDSRDQSKRKACNGKYCSIVRINLYLYFWLFRQL